MRERPVARYYQKTDEGLILVNKMMNEVPRYYQNAGNGKLVARGTPVSGSDEESHSAASVGFGRSSLPDSSAAREEAAAASRSRPESSSTPPPLKGESARRSFNSESSSLGEKRESNSSLRIVAGWRSLTTGHRDHGVGKGAKQKSQPGSARRGRASRVSPVDESRTCGQCEFPVSPNRGPPLETLGS